MPKALKPDGIVACVSDSYDIYNACKLWGTELKEDVINSGATVVIRPDSGHPATVVLECLKILDEYFGSTINEKGYKVLNNVRVIQGDGITLESITEIIDTFVAAGYSADNVAFGQGGALLQIVNRDDQKFAMKCSAVRINGKWVDVFKDPITDQGKQSKKGRLKLVKTDDGELLTLRQDEAVDRNDLLQIVYDEGMMTRRISFDEVRKNAEI